VYGIGTCLCPLMVFDVVSVEHSGSSSKVILCLKIFEVASSPNSDIDHYVTIRKLLGCIFNIRWEPTSPYQRSHYTGLFFHKVVCPRCDTVSEMI
jgi:hypothetical protein